MSAVDEYRASDLWNVTLPETTDEGTLYRPDIPVVRKSLADAAIVELERYLAAGREEWRLGCDRIAELEAEKNLYFTKMQEEFKRAEQVEAELAALKEKHEWILDQVKKVCYTPATFSPRPNSFWEDLEYRWAEREKP